MSVQNPGLSYSSQRPKINGRQITLTSKTAASPVKSNAASFLSNTSRSSIFTPALRSNTFAMYSNRMDYTQLRNSLNANIHYVPRVNVNGTPMYVQNNELGPMDKLALAMTAIKGAGTITKELLGLAMDIKSSGTSKTGNSAISTLNKLNSDVKANSAAPANKTTAASNNSAAASSISDMKGADNSTDLRSAIESAKEKQMELSQQRAQIHGSLDSLKAEAEKAETAIKDLNTKIDSKKKDVSEKENDVNQKESNLRSTEKDKDSKLQTLKNMEAAVGQAATDYTNACEALTSAEATLASTPEYITNPDGTKVKNPAYDTAKKAVETAEQNKAKAKEALDKAKADKEKAVEN